MSKKIVVARGIFSTLSIELNNDVFDKLAYIQPKDNPLALIQEELNRLSEEFEKTYFEAVNKEKS